MMVYYMLILKIYSKHLTFLVLSGKMEIFLADLLKMKAGLIPLTMIQNK